jgi:putative glutamine amidotransferase
VILTGGDDIQPALYEADLTPRLKKTISPADPLRDAFELAVIREVFRQRKPLLAICRGQQLVNVAFGGTLIVDIALQVADAFNHSRTDLKDRIVHDVEIQAGSLLHNIFKTTRLGVNSSHHQAVGRVAEPFQVTARGPDGVIECLELAPQNARLLPYFLAVQFHPERLVQPHPEFLKLFKSFIRACRSVSNEA